MASLNVRGTRFSFEGPEGETVLLDCGDLLSNKSRIPMHRLPGQSHPILPEILVNLIRRQQSAEGRFAIPFGLMDVLLTSRLIRSAKPVRLLEYGSGQGELSAHLAELLGTFHEESALACAYDTIEPAWMERISHVKKPPKLSFLAGDFGALGLQSGSFDIVLINGLADFQNPCEVVADALRLARGDGAILCYTNASPLLESVFKLFFKQREEFVLYPEEKVLLAEAKDACWQAEDTPPVDIGEMERLVARSLKSGRKAALAALETLKCHVDAAVRQGDAGRKIQLLEQREKLVEYITRS